MFLEYANLAGVSNCIRNRFLDILKLAIILKAVSKSYQQKVREKEQDGEEITRGCFLLQIITVVRKCWVKKKNVGYVATGPEWTDREFGVWE